MASLALTKRISLLAWMGARPFVSAPRKSPASHKNLTFLDDHRSSTYLFPGVDIRDVLNSEQNTIGEQNQDMVNFKSLATAQELEVAKELTGPSIATALAAGLAALLLHCTKLGVYFTQQMREKELEYVDPIEARAIARNGEFRQMSGAFNRLCATNEQKLKYVNPATSLKVSCRR